MNARSQETLALPPALDVERAVDDRYTRGAESPEASLCCPASCDPGYLEAIPDEVLERDYGCGDPTRHLKPGETVVDLGSGSGKSCFIASQVVGAAGRVIGVDVNDAMLALARRHEPEVGRRTGYRNVSFVKARIQDLALDLEALARRLRERPVSTPAELDELQRELAAWRVERPLIADQSVDAVISSCVLNLVAPADKRQLFREIHRVLRRGGRAVISDVVSDEDVPEAMQSDPELWSGCIAGALREDLFLRAFEEAGFYGITVTERQEKPWRVVEGIEFRSLTVTAYKGKEGPCWDHKEAVIYGGPFRKVEDDDGHLFERGVRTAVCRKTFAIISAEPYRTMFDPVEPLVPVEAAAAQPFPCVKGALRRHPRETKGEDYSLTTEAATGVCDPEAGCC